MGTILKRWRVVTFILFAVACGTVACGSGDVPTSLSDEERSRLVDLVEQESSWIETPSCQVEIFRQDADITYGWATCVTAASAPDQELDQGHSYPFRADGNELSTPGDGSDYQKNVEKLFPEDLWPAIEQHAVGLP
ncbi:hypothetical protein [Glutamicibacter arilaitensis]|uniref:hypothetical protein n=1 Tax=Glutamicibacter arilaitensis TaxID=256701 RepID=UPI00384DE9DF